MRDVVLVITVVAFFALAVLYVRWCDRIVGPDDDAVVVPVGDDAEPRDAVGGPVSAAVLAVTSAGVDNAVGLVLAVVVVAYLVVALVRPESF